MSRILVSRAFLPALALVCFVPAVVTAQQVVHFGDLKQFTGPDDLDLAGEIVYAVDLNGDTDRVVNGVEFLTDNNPIPGYVSTFTHTVSGWETKPEYGGTTDDNNLEEIMHDIRWTNAGVAGGDIGVTMDVFGGHSYQLQLLWSGNHVENRRWSVEINGVLTLEEVQSLAEQVYDVGRSTVYTYSFLSMSNTLSVRYVQGTTGDDANGILHALILERLGTDLVPGDVNGDELANMADFFIIRDNFLSSPATREQGDLNFSGVVDFVDFEEWKNAAFPAAAVPEPGSLAMLTFGIVLLDCWKRRRRRSI